MNYPAYNFPDNPYRKIRAILQAALNYLSLEDLIAVKIDAVKGRKQQVWEEGVALQENNLKIDENLFTTIKDEYIKTNDFQLAAALPMIVHPDLHV
jgi:hypothetical protein